MSSPIHMAVRAAALAPAVPDGAGGGGQEFCFGPGFPGFAGHFPGFPILPAVLQVECARATAEALRGAVLETTGVENAKFLAPVRPGETLSVRLVLLAPGGYSARLSVEGKAVASFTLSLAEGEGASP